MRNVCLITAAFKLWFFKQLLFVSQVIRVCAFCVRVCVFFLWSFWYSQIFVFHTYPAIMEQEHRTKILSKIDRLVSYTKFDILVRACLHHQLLSEETVDNIQVRIKTMLLCFFFLWNTMRTFLDDFFFNFVNEFICSCIRPKRRVTEN